MEGLYIIEVTALESNSSVQFYAKVGKEENDRTYPALPADHQVAGAEVKKGRIAITWKPSPDETPFDNIVDYCIAISRRRGYATSCALKSHLNEVLKDSSKKATTLYKCLEESNENKFLFNKARPGTRYHINVYVKNRNTGRTNAYKGLVIKTKVTNKVKKLREGRIRTVSLKKRKDRQKLKFTLNSTARKLYFSVQSCSGRVKVQVTKKGSKLINSWINGIKSFTLENLKKGAYNIKVTNGRKGKRQVKFFITRSKKLHEPSSATDASVSVESNSTTCSNITVTWPMNGRRKTFCVYKKEIKGKKERRKLDMCSIPKTKSSEAESCEQVRIRRGGSKGKLSHTFTDLKAGTLYKFDVVERRRNNMTLLYSGVTQRTKDGC